MLIHDQVYARERLFNAAGYGPAPLESKTVVRGATSHECNALREARMRAIVWSASLFGKFCEGHARCLFVCARTRPHGAARRGRLPRGSRRAASAPGALTDRSGIGRIDAQDPAQSKVARRERAKRASSGAASGSGARDRRRSLVASRFVAVRLVLLSALAVIASAAVAVVVRVVIRVVVRVFVVISVHAS